MDIIQEIEKLDIDDNIKYILSIFNEKEYVPKTYKRTIYLKRKIIQYSQFPNLDRNGEYKVFIFIGQSRDIIEDSNYICLPNKEVYDCYRCVKIKRYKDDVLQNSSTIKHGKIIIKNYGKVHSRWVSKITFKDDKRIICHRNKWFQSENIVSPRFERTRLSLSFGMYQLPIWDLYKRNDKYKPTLILILYIVIFCYMIGIYLGYLILD